MIHGDDFIIAGSEEAVRKTQAMLESHYPCVSQVIGEGEHLQREVVVLGRKVSVDNDGWHIEVHEKYLQKALGEGKLYALVHIL